MALITQAGPKGKGVSGLTCHGGGEESRETRGLTCGQARGAAAAPAQSPCSADIARTAAGRPSSAPSTKAPPGHPGGAHPRSRSWRRILGFPRLTQGDGAAVGVEVKRDYPPAATLSGVKKRGSPREIQSLEPHLSLRGPRGLWGPMQPGCRVEEQGCCTVMHQAGRLFQGLQLPGLGKWTVSTGPVARAESQDGPGRREWGTHTDGHAGWGRALLPRDKQVLHLHLALQL